MDYEFIIMTCLLILCFYIRTTYGIAFLTFWLVVGLFGFFFTSNGMDLGLEYIEKSDIFFECFQGDYQTLYNKLSLFHTIRKKFRLPQCFKPFGIFYDNPEKDKKCRAVIGIIVEQKEKNEKYKEYIDKDFREYMKENKFKIDTISKTNCLHGLYDTMFSVMYSFVFIAKIYIKMINLKFFTRLYNPKWKDSHIKNARKNYKKKSGVLEIYDHKIIKFYIPLENEDGFSFFSQ